jgi:formylglycine-generating enzyme required for sulfatase activity
MPTSASSLSAVVAQGDAYVGAGGFPLSPKQIEERLAPYREYLVQECRFIPLRGVRRDDRREQGDPQHVTDDDPDHRLELERLFVELDTRTEIKVESGKRGGVTAPRVHSMSMAAEDRTRETRKLAALEALTISSPHVVLHGSPGCGKSTFVRFLVLALANCGLGRQEQWLPRLPSWPEAQAALLPVRVELRHFAVWLRDQRDKAVREKAERKGGEEQQPPSELEFDLPKPCHLWNFITRQLAALGQDRNWQDPLPAIEPLVREGKAIFLLDGLDEAPGAAGKLFVRDCIEAFAREGMGKPCRIVVTCRTRSYDADYKKRSLHRFEHKPIATIRSSQPADTPTVGPAFEVAPFDDTKKKRFIKCWYDALEALREISRAEADERIRALQSAVCSLDPENQKLADLAANPLLLTVIAHLHSSQSDLKLPDNRAQLFHDLLDLLLTRWAERHQRGKNREATGETLAQLLAEPGLKGFDEKGFLKLVAEMACEHYRGGQKEKLIVIPKSKLRQRLEEEHQDPDTNKGADWAERVLNFIQYRAGLLNSPDGEDYDFPHSLLGEYLAAYHLAHERRSSEVVAAKVTPDGNWDEVVRLVAGHHVFVEKEPRDALDLVEELCREAQAGHGCPDAITDLQWRRVALAADVLQEMGPERWTRVRNQGTACRDLVRNLVVLLLDRGALPPRDRARAGAVLGGLGDPRLGVGLCGEGRLPRFVWCGPGGEEAVGRALDFGRGFPAEPFPMGGDPEAWSSSAKPFCCRRIGGPFFLGKYPVTVAQYRVFVEQGGYGEPGLDAVRPPWWTEAGWAWRNGRADTAGCPDWFVKWYRDLAVPVVGPESYGGVFESLNHPQVGVSWHEAVAYCGWLNRRVREGGWGEWPEGGQVRLPTEAEWELAARWNRPWDGRVFAWGSPAEGEGIEAHLSGHCNWHGTGIGHTSAVGLFPAGRAVCGALDLTGNVWEWCQSKWMGLGDAHAQKDYNLGQGKAATLDAEEGYERETRVLRGGSWDYNRPGHLRAAGRGGVRPGDRGTYYGFRVVLCVGESR